MGAVVERTHRSERAREQHSITAQTPRLQFVSMCMLLAGGVALLLLLLLSLENELQSDWAGAGTHQNHVMYLLGIWTSLTSTLIYATILLLMRNGSRHAIFAAITLATLLCLAVPVLASSDVGTVCGCEMA
jgi:hypothetical protein